MTTTETRTWGIMCQDGVFYAGYKSLDVFTAMVECGSERQARTAAQHLRDEWEAARGKPVFKRQVLSFHLRQT